MSQTAAKIKVIEGAVALGFPLSDAVQRALGQSLSDFARARGFTIQAVSMCLRSYEGRVYPEIRDAICDELEIPREYLDRLIDAQPGKAAAGGEAGEADRAAA